MLILLFTIFLLGFGCGAAATCGYVALSIHRAGAARAPAPSTPAGQPPTLELRPVRWVELSDVRQGAPGAAVEGPQRVEAAANGWLPPETPKTRCDFCTRVRAALKLPS